MDADLLMQTIAEVLKKIEDYSISNRAEFEALVKKNLAMQQTDQTKKQQKRIPQITTRLEQIDKVLNKLYEDNALGTIPQDRYEQMSQKYSEEYYALKAELATLQEQLSAYENAGGRNAMLPLPSLPPPFSTSLSAGLKCMSATRKGRDTQSSTSAYISIISASLRTK